MIARSQVRRVLHLPAEPGSPSRARGFVRDLLADADRLDWSEDASLAVSELVTNAVLHAHSDIELIGEVTAEHLRIEVRDDNPVLPAARSYDDHATTGRGLELVAAVTSAHGVDSLGSAGKVVWCCVGGGSGPDERTEDELLAEWDDDLELTSQDDEVDGAEETDGDALPVVLQQLPATLWLAAREHHDAVLRELALLRAAGEQPGAVDVAAVDAARSALETAVDADLERARREGEASVPLPQYHPGALPAVPDSMELRLRVRPGEADAFAQLQDVLDEGERLATAEQLLVRPALPEVVAVRDWACEQVIAQLAGSPAAPWPGADDERFTADVDEDVTTGGWDDAPVTRAEGGAIAVDDSNRVVAVSAALARLLGWEVADLVGRRVVAIVPPRYREAHVAGFSRHLSTGDARALGVELVLPVLRADGEEVDCRFLIESTPTPGGRTVYVAQITPLSEVSTAER